MHYLSTLPTFLLYFVAAGVLFAAFLTIYLRVTPYAELALIRQGNVAAAISLVGAMVGFVLPVANVITHSSSLLDMSLWSLVALLVQTIIYFLVSWLLPEFKRGIEQGNLAQAILLAGASVVAGFLNAACMTY